MKNIITGIILIALSFISFNWWDGVVGSASIVESQTSLFVYILPYAASFVFGMVGLTTTLNGINTFRDNETQSQETA
ncbi:hypothetical protein [Pseudalkalibacillus berkeleyi]|uniref:DUF3955 domain-containing protein n=1 Tax=Pseudalkalibacillus berkeleyi TaxID=1069813 RepID=A0ABS9GX15_9BACL|nr:hypothetical protein [Pseudalkalibacillus berkeleyi]MCF6136271.1 hypothetical protein [Pseudalkalibacillus berkeleyi]